MYSLYCMCFLPEDMICACCALMTKHTNRMQLPKKGDFGKLKFESQRLVIFAVIITKTRYIIHHLNHPQLYQMKATLFSECSQIPTDGLILKGWYTTLTLAVYGSLTTVVREVTPPPPPPPPQPRLPGTTTVANVMSLNADSQLVVNTA